MSIMLAIGKLNNLVCFRDNVYDPVSKEKPGPRRQVWTRIGSQRGIQAVARPYWQRTAVADLSSRWSASVDLLRCHSDTAC